MPRARSTSGLDLHLEVRRPHVRDSVERGLRDAVASGRLAAGTPLPPSRALAADLAVARNTVAEAYGQLVAEGWLVARQGSATRVAPRPGGAPPPPGPAAGPRQPRYLLNPGYPDVSSFPRSEWLAASRVAWGRAPSDAFGYGDPAGRPELRSALAGYLARARGVRVRPEAVLVCGGFTRGLALVAAALRSRGARAVGVEAFGHAAHRQVLAAAGLRVSALPVDADGAVPAGLDGLDAVVLTPAHQFPTGVALSPARRAAFTAWAARTGGVLVEDDYDGEFRYDRRAVGAVQALSPEHVVYAGTASKTLAPGLRLGWLVAPPRLLPSLLAAAGGVIPQAGVLEQLTMAEFVSSGRYDRHVRRARLTYSRRRSRLLAELASRVPAARPSGMNAGLHTVLALPPGLGEAEAVRRAASRDLLVDPLGDYATAGATAPPALVVGYATPPPHAYTTALARLCAALT